jgi:hypothetical protein
VYLHLAASLFVFNTQGIQYFCCGAKTGETHLEKIGTNKKSKPKSAHFCQVYLSHKMSGRQAAHDDKTCKNSYCAKNSHNFPHFG